MWIERQKNLPLLTSEMCVGTDPAFIRIPLTSFGAEVSF